MVVNMFRADLRVTSKAKALEFYKGIKGVTLIPYYDELFIRVEPNHCISVVTKSEIKGGTAAFVPSMRDDTGAIAYRYRKHINAYLSAE